MTYAQYTFFPPLFEQLDRDGFAVLSVANWQQLTGKFPQLNQQFNIPEFGKQLVVTGENLQRNEITVGYVL